MDQKWHYRFLDLTDRIATWSKDPSRGVGCVIVSPSKQIVSTGFNGIPRGIEDRPDRLERPTKYDLVCHAEMNAIVQCARNGVPPLGCLLYSSFFPCIQCALAIIQAGLAEVITYEVTVGDERWVESIAKSRAVFAEAKIGVTELMRVALGEAASR
ncbi:MAG: dCMP deaminase family protein [Phycisphaerae bacterium]|nr:dCMP deaminase family protein [Phycisphaerae bacterium]